jgi:hypothetical protein
MSSVTTCAIISDMKAKRPYKKITPRVIAEHATQEILSGNASAAVRELELYDDDQSGLWERSDGAIQKRAYRIVRKREGVSTSEYIEDQLQQIGVEAVQRVSELVQSRDERIALKSATYAIDHIRGKAVSRSISVTGRLNIQSVLD